jgi:hypothetical protein
MLGVFANNKSVVDAAIVSHAGKEIFMHLNVRRSLPKPIAYAVLAAALILAFSYLFKHDYLSVSINDSPQAAFYSEIINNDKVEAL